MEKAISSYEIARRLFELPKLYGSCFNELVLCEQDKRGGKLSNGVEVDETFIGGKSRNMHKSLRARIITGTGRKDKDRRHGMMERDRNVRG